jgi:hypothetical protein
MEQVATLPPAGASRSLDLIWPGRLTAAGGAGGYDTSCTMRHGTASILGTTTGIGGGTTNIADVKLGVPAVKHVCTGVAGNAFNFPFPVVFPTSKSNIIPAYNDAAVYRVVWMFAGSGLAPNANTDFGLEFIHASVTTRIFTGAGPGWGFRLVDGNTLAFVCRGGNGLIQQNLTVAPFDTSIWHVLDIRMTAATQTQDALLTALLDDVPLNLGGLNSSWAAGTNLPVQQLSGGFVGFFPSLVISGGNANNYWTHQLRMIAAPSAFATL